MKEKRGEKGETGEKAERCVSKKNEVIFGQSACSQREIAHIIQADEKGSRPFSR
jgi:hypothetical protein